MTSLEHQLRMLAFCEEQEAKKLARARAIFDVVSLLAIVRPLVTDKQLQTRISLALLNSYLAFEGEVKVELPENVVPISKLRA